MSAKKQRGGRREGAGRKPVDPSVRRSSLIGYYVNPTEFATIYSAAEERGLTVSEYTRLRVLGKRLPPLDSTNAG